MNNIYLNVAAALRQTYSKTKEVIDSTGTTKTFEDRIAYRNIESLSDEIDRVIDKLDYLSRPVIEGKLREMDNGKFELLADGRQVAYFSCGDRLEVYSEDEEEWMLGRVEHTTRDGQSGYYFYGADKPFLYTGMKARIRKAY